MRSHLAATAALAAGLCAPLAAQAADCGRNCLTGVMDTYLRAMVDHRPAEAPLAASAKLAENAFVIPFGDGFWKDASALPSDFKVYVPDPVSHEVGFLGVMGGEGGKPVQVALRLKVDGDGKITEAEQIVVRNLRDTSVANLKAPRPGLVTEIPEGQRLDRQAVIDSAIKYYDAVDNNRGADAPFADDCERQENGMKTTGVPARPGDPSTIPGSLGCSDQLDTNIMAYIGPIERRYMFADPVTGLAMGWSIFRHPALETTFRVFNVPGYEERTLDNANGGYDNFAAHVIKVDPEGRIHEIEAAGFVGAGKNLPSPF